MSYYKNFGLVLGNPLWRVYIRWVLDKSIDDFGKLRFKPDFKKKNFTCLLCGVGNEATAEEYIKFVVKRNENPAVWIIDLGKEQIDAVKTMISRKFPKLNVKIKQTNALELDQIIKPGSIDWLETDGLFEFFDNKSLKKLLAVWKNILNKDGFITTTATSSRWKFQEYVDRFKVWTGRVWLGVTVYRHTREEMRNNIISSGFEFVEGPTFIPYFKRYSIVKT
ncbi:hypothetical protein M1328_01230 [Patescibacteria group bacterium]|nr:hypothetical protein [Patescibacteria group bacterium]